MPEAASRWTTSGSSSGFAPADPDQAPDPFGVRPLVLGDLDGSPILASETCALDMVGAQFVRDVEHGEVVDRRHLSRRAREAVGVASEDPDQGGVRLEVRRGTEAAAADSFCFTVTDTGPGIEPEALTEIFAAFAQTKAGAAAGGTGLGLALTRKLVELHGGRIMVESEQGVGSTFIVYLPLRVEPTVTE